MALNLHDIAGNATSIVSPWVNVSIEFSQGYEISESGKQTPKFSKPVLIRAKIQALSYSDLQHIASLNLQGERRAMYISGNIDALLRPDAKGGDLVTFPDGTVWLVAMVIEDWYMTNGWIKAAVTRQMGK